jgi:hypothetical protein
MPQHYCRSACPRSSGSHRLAKSRWQRSAAATATPSLVSRSGSPPARREVAMTQNEAVTNRSPSQSLRCSVASRDHRRHRPYRRDSKQPECCTREEVVLHDFICSAKHPHLFCQRRLAEVANQYCRTDEPPLQNCWMGSVSLESLMRSLLKRSRRGVCHLVRPPSGLRSHRVGGER